MFKLIALLIAFVTPSVTFAQLMTQPEMREYVEMALQQKSIPIEVPYFTPFRGKDGIKYSYSLGGVKSQSFSTSYARTGLLSIPLQEQFRASIIRKYRNTPVRRRFWKPRLDAIEKEIAAMLQEIDSSGDEQDRWNRVAAHTRNIEHIYHHAMIDAEIISSDAPELKNPCYTCSETYKVAISTNPEWGVVEYLPAGDWDLYIFRTKTKREPNVPKPEWLTVEQGSVDLGGKYWFRVSWNGDERYKRLLHITKETPLVFRPER